MAKSRGKARKPRESKIGGSNVIFEVTNTIFPITLKRNGTFFDFSFQEAKMLLDKLTRAIDWLEAQEK